MDQVLVTFAAAFAGGLAAMAVGMAQVRSRANRDAREHAMRALARHMDRLSNYGLAHSQVVASARASTAGKDWPRIVPSKPPMAAAIAEIQAVRVNFSRIDRNAIDEVIQELRSAEVSGDLGERALDWSKEAASVAAVADRLSRWGGTSP